MSTMQELADQINAQTQSASKGVAADIFVSASGFISLAFDLGETVTPQRLERVILENFTAHVTSAGQDALDEVDMKPLRGA